MHTMSFDMINDMMNQAAQSNQLNDTTSERTMLNPVNIKTEQQAAEAVVPMLFGHIAQRATYMTYEVIEQQLAACAIFRSLFLMDGQYTAETFAECVAYDLVEFNKRNRDKGALDVVLESVEIAVDMGFLECVDGMYIQSPKFIDICNVKMSTAPSTTPIDDLARNTTMIKGDRAQACPMLKESIKFQQATQFTVEKRMSLIAQEVRKATPKLSIWKDIRNSMSGVAIMDDTVAYYSEITADTRGRTYFESHFGANPQGCDYNRAVYSLVTDRVVMLDSIAYSMFMNELGEAAGKHAKFMQHEYLMRVARSPAKALQTFLVDKQNEELDVDSTMDWKTVSAPFTYVRLALDYAKFQETGSCVCKVPMGLDAKCSGTQILAILAGNMELLQATGFSAYKVADPYMLCAKALGDGATRDLMKQPYMVVQYGGGAKSLITNSKLMAFMDRCGYDMDKGSKRVIAAVKQVLGKRIVSMQDGIAQAVADKMKATDSTSLQYKHLDGQVVNYQVCEMVEITAYYTEVRYTQATVIGFGSKEQCTGLSVSTGIPSAEEFARTFMVNFVQGVDALVARTVAAFAKDAGLKGYVSIHDCFRTELADAPLLMQVIRDAYNHLFVKHDILAHLAKQIGFDTCSTQRILTSEMVYEDNAYFFCQ